MVEHHIVIDGTFSLRLDIPAKINRHDIDVLNKVLRSDAFIQERLRQEDQEKGQDEAERYFEGLKEFAKKKEAERQARLKALQDEEAAQTAKPGPPAHFGIEELRNSGPEGRLRFYIWRAEQRMQDAKELATECNKIYWATLKNHLPDVKNPAWRWDFFHEDCETCERIKGLHNATMQARGRAHRLNEKIKLMRKDYDERFPWLKKRTAT